VPLPSEKPEYRALFAAGLHALTIEELERDCVLGFTLSTTRQVIFRNLLHVVAELTDNRIVGELLIDGSFITTKINPRDVDLVLCVSSELYDGCSAGQRSVFNWFESEALRADYRCDGYISVEWPAAHPLYAEGIATRNYWLTFFGHTREGHEKGIGVLTLS
jgi:hypothetical protein